MNSHLKIWEIFCFCIDAFYWFFSIHCACFLIEVLLYFYVVKIFDRSSSFEGMQWKKEKMTKGTENFAWKSWTLRISTLTIYLKFWFLWLIEQNHMSCSAIFKFLMMILQQVHLMMDCSKHLCFLRIIDQLLDCSLVKGNLKGELEKCNFDIFEHSFCFDKLIYSNILLSSWLLDCTHA